MDRIDIQKEVHPVDFFAIADQKSGASSEELRTKVEKARKIQQERYVQEKGINCNAQMTTELMSVVCNNGRVYYLIKNEIDTNTERISLIVITYDVR